ncbi:MAG TPA: hypothetical protein VF428_02835 [Casimicrobiaceae bacterium]|jgi:hypothetical protein
MIRLPSAGTKHAATLAALLATLFAAAIALGGCGVKGPLRPAPATTRKAPATAPAATTAPGTAPNTATERAPTSPATTTPATTQEPTTPGKPAS